MKKIYDVNRVLVIDGDACLDQAVLKTKKFITQNKLKLKSPRESLNFIYHFFIINVFQLINSEQLKFRSTIVFYDSGNKNQLLEQKFFVFLLKKIKKSCPIPVFTILSKNKADVPYAAERCLQNTQAKLNMFYKTIYKDSLVALQKLYASKVSLFS